MKFRREHSCLSDGCNDEDEDLDFFHVMTEVRGGEETRNAHMAVSDTVHGTAESVSVFEGDQLCREPRLVQLQVAVLDGITVQAVSHSFD